MKRIALTRNLLVLLVSVLITSLTFNSYAQSEVITKMDSVKNEPEIPNLTDEQNNEVQDLSVRHLNVVTQLNQELAEKEAYLITIISADSIDRVAMNKTIDDISIIKGKILKNNANYTIDVALVKKEPKKVLIVLLVKAFLESIFKHY